VIYLAGSQASQKLPIMTIPLKRAGRLGDTSRFTSPRRNAE
jgi:hypothetical protein